MSDNIIVALITGASVAIPTMLTSWFNRKKVEGKLEVVKQEINGRMTELVSAEKKVSHAEGKEEQKQETKEENKL